MTPQRTAEAVHASAARFFASRRRSPRRSRPRGRAHPLLYDKVTPAQTPRFAGFTRHDRIATPPTYREELLEIAGGAKWRDLHEYPCAALSRPGHPITRASASQVARRQHWLVHEPARSAKLPRVFWLAIRTGAGATTQKPWWSSTLRWAQLATPAHRHPTLVARSLFLPRICSRLG